MYYWVKAVRRGEGVQLPTYIWTDAIDIDTSLLELLKHRLYSNYRNY